MSSDSLDSVLVGKTLIVYKYLIQSKSPQTAREIQRGTNLSTPSLAVFHLEKLEHAGLIAKSDDGRYSVIRVYLKHYLLLRRLLVPRFIFHVTIALLFLAGYAILTFLIYYQSNSFLSIHTSPQSAVAVLLTYGFLTSMVIVALFLFETGRVLRKEQM